MRPSAESAAAAAAPPPLQAELLAQPSPAASDSSPTAALLLPGAANEAAAQSAFAGGSGAPGVPAADPGAIGAAMGDNPYLQKLPPVLRRSVCGNGARQHTRAVYQGER